jgi:outer membrane protein assembly factor BamB
LHPARAARRARQAACSRGGLDGRCAQPKRMCRALVERLGTGILGSPAVANGIVYVDNANGVFALDARTGAERWVYRSGDGDNGSPSVVDGTLYFGSSGLIALNAATGQYKWRHDTGGYIDLSSPAVANGTVYIGATDGNVYAINADTGALRWTYATAWNIESSPAVAGGVDFIGSYDGRVRHCQIASSIPLRQCQMALSTSARAMGTSIHTVRSAHRRRQLPTNVAADDSDSGRSGVGTTRIGRTHEKRWSSRVPRTLAGQWASRAPARGQSGRALALRLPSGRPVSRIWVLREPAADS